MRRSTSVLLVALTLGGCATPRFDGEHRIRFPTPDKPAPVSDATGIPTASDVVKHIQCEIRAAQDDPRFQAFKDGEYIVFASLTLEVSNGGGLNPSLSFTHMLETIGKVDQKRVIGLSGKYVQTAHRTYSQTFVLNLAAEAHDADAQCREPDVSPDHQGLRGGLRIAETIAAGMNNAASIFRAPEAPGPGTPSSVIPTFGTTVDFTLLKGGGLNPSWTLVDFSGPTGGNSNLLDFNQTTKDSLTLSFASPGKADQKEIEKAVSAKIGSDSSLLARPGVDRSAIRAEITAQDEAARRAAAAAAAQDSVFRLLLQRIVPQ